MKKVLFIFLIFPLICLAQKEVQTGDEKAKLVESLKLELYQDTIKFKKEDLIFTPIGRKNSNSYAKLFLILQKRKGSVYRYAYKLDIIAGSLVKQFAQTILNPDIIDSLEVLQGNSATAIYGEAAKNGLVIMYLNKETDINLKISGLKMTAKRNGDNYSVRNVDELLLHD